jgi:tRNA 2-selenouridine synthase
MTEAADAGGAPERRPRGIATIAELAAFDEIIDVRSSAEFAEDRIPGSLSCPVLDDDERHEIGTLYKQVSPFDARRRGAAYVARNIAAHLLAHFQDRPRNWRPLVLCWRGGQRSGSMTTVLRSVGWDACQLQGGYKAFRRHVVEQLEVLPGRLRLRVIEGATGSGKTRLLHEIARMGGTVLDLEELACHRGSVLGGLPEQEQPGQKWFETRLWQALAALDPAQPVFVEGESRKIGRLRLPEALFAAMRAAPRVEVCAGVAARVGFLLADYGHFLGDPGRLNAQLDTLRTVLGHERINAWQALVARGDFAGLTEALLHEHYDPLYARSRRRNRAGEPEFTVTIGSLDGPGIAAAAAEILRRSAAAPVAGEPLET